MKDDHDDLELSRQEEELLRSLNRELVPPPELESQVTDALRRRDLVRSTAHRRGFYLQAWQALAAALVLAALGFLAGRWPTSRPAAPRPDLPRFLLLLYEDPDRSASPDAAHRQYEEYASWAEQLRRRGAFEAGDPIDTLTHLMREVDGELRVAPGSEPRDDQVLSGYFMIRARDSQEALRTARQCPHLKYDGTVAIHPVGGR